SRRIISRSTRRPPCRSGKSLKGRRVSRIRFTRPGTSISAYSAQSRRLEHDVRDLVGQLLQSEHSPAFQVGQDHESELLLGEQPEIAREALLDAAVPDGAVGLAPLAFADVPAVAVTGVPSVARLLALRHPREGLTLDQHSILDGDREAREVFRRGSE